MPPRPGQVESAVAEAATLTLGEGNSRKSRRTSGGEVFCEAPGLQNLLATLYQERTLRRKLR